MTARPLPRARADALAKVDLELDVGICHACLSFVSLALAGGDPRDVARETRRTAPYLWDEGLAEPALAAMRRACELGVADAEAALADLEGRGGRSSVARAIVRRLAEDLHRRASTELRAARLARDRPRRGAAGAQLSLETAFAGWASRTTGG